MQQPRKRVVRARQRDRAASFPGFDRNLVPLPNEWMVDRLLIRVEGRWRARGNGQLGPGSGREFCGARFADPRLDWMCLPDRSDWQYSVSSHTPPRSTFGFLEIVMKGVQRAEGRVEVSIMCNPTRTLANLIARYGDQEDFLAYIASRPVAEFFGFADEGAISLSLDPQGRDNYIAHRGQMLSLLGGDFSAFMPIFVEKVQDVLAMLLSATMGQYHFDGGRQHIEDHDGEVVLDWMDTKVPQIESYFERFHADAVSAVRTAGLSILARDSRNTLRRYSDVDLERGGDCFRVSLPISETRKLAVYAKTPTRIRFEVRRHGRARYSGMVPEVSPTGRICAIVLHEREQAIRSCRWREEVGPQFDEPAAPSTGDLVELVSKIVLACKGKESAVRAVMTRLIVDGGLSVGLDAAVPDAVLSRLEGADILRRVKIRSSRQASGIPHRYSLTEDYDSLRLTLADALRGGDT